MATIAGVGSNFMRTMRGVSVAKGAARGYKSGIALGQDDRELDRRQRALELTEEGFSYKKQQDLSKKAGEELDAHKRENFGIAMSVLGAKDPQTAMMGLQKGGLLPSDLTQDTFAAFMVENDIDNQLPEFRKNLRAQKNKDRDYQLSVRKQDEVERKNRTDAKAAKQKGGDSERGKAVDEKTMRQVIIDSGYIDRDWDVLSSRYVIKDPEVDKEIKGLTTRAIKLFNDNPDMSINEASDKALRAGGYNIKTATGGTAPAFAGNQSPVRAYDPQSRTLR